MICDGIRELSSPTWQPIETAPKSDEIDLWANGERLANCWWGRETYGGKEMTWVRHSYDDCNGPVFVKVTNPTHWMAIPEGPAA